MPDCFVLAADVGFVDAHFNELLGVVSEIGQWGQRAVQEFRESVTIESTLIFIVCLDIDHFHAVVVAKLATCRVRTRG